jgi:hypothetical protein
MSFDPQGLGEARLETGWVCIRNVVPGETRRTEQRGSATRAAGTQKVSSDTHFGHTCREKYGADICRLQEELTN